MPRWSIPSGPPILVWLGLALLPAFALTAFVTSAHRDEHRHLAAEWTARGEAALAAGDPAGAILALRNAQAYARDDRILRFHLAQALIASGRSTEARTYLLTLWDQQPGSGPVNLELGRLAANEGDVNRARRYYRGAIEGAWEDEAEQQRRAARLELAEFLIARGADIPAQAELISLAGDLPVDSAVRVRVARSFLDVGLPRRALLLLEEYLVETPGDPAALAVAGRASFDLANYPGAVALLTKARAAGADPADVEPALEIARLVITADPYQRRLRASERAARAARAFEASRRRLQDCEATGALQGTALQPLAEEAETLEPQVTPAALLRDRDLVDAAVDLALRIQTAAAPICGPPEALDRALLLLAGERQEPGP